LAPEYGILIFVPNDPLDPIHLVDHTNSDHQRYILEQE
jgi:hypothetical protein